MLVKTGERDRSGSMRNVGLAIVMVMGAAAFFRLSGFAQPAQVQPASMHSAGASVAPAVVPVAAADPLNKLAFLTGTWRGTVGEDQVEEIWSAPTGDAMVGVFRWISHGKTTLYELLSIKAEGNDAVLRLRHFHGDFEPWKGECDGVAAQKATTIEPSKVIFENATQVGGVAGCDYWVKGDTLFIKVRFSDANRPALEFELKRVNEKKVQ